MEEGKKKRWRPSLTAYRALESENEELKKGNVTKVLRDHIDALEAENTSLKHSCTQLKKKLAVVRDQVKGAVVDYNRARREVLWLRGRSLWKRIINDTYYKEEGD